VKGLGVAFLAVGVVLGPARLHAQASAPAAAPSPETGTPSQRIEAECGPQLQARIDEAREKVDRSAAPRVRIRQLLAALPDWIALLDAPTTPEACRDALREVRDGQAREAQENSSELAQSLDAAASNPGSRALSQRAATVREVALALRNSGFLSADQNAVTLNLNAASVFCKNKANDCGWDRVGGSVTFGSKIPEKDIVGFSGIPDPNRLLDVLVWDTNLRLLGDRRPDSAHWKGERNAMAFHGWALTRAIHQRMFPDGISTTSMAQEAEEMRLELKEVANRDYAALQQRIGTSLLVSVSFSGQHLTQEKGKNKYSGTLLVDKGLGANVGFTFNASYSSVQDVVVSGGGPSTLRTFRTSAALSGDFMKNVIVDKRSTEWSLAGRLALPDDEKDLGRKKVFEVALDLRFPVSESAHVPLVVTFTNDPNSITKQKFVRGQIGINYDFGALKKLFTSS
jgi:hypothetical protein